MPNGHRAICAIARDIQDDWKNMNYAAKPYIEAMKYLGGIREAYGQDDAESIILYFLSNAGTYRGENAKRYKAELKAILASNK